ncbi:hypothetical protein AMECASPLE_038785 [Ameca splendens]|uniref:Uncharacterized protein n=1 Tax=Ameca splendens TaxID=208324 RepID=A0ABV0ZIU9_9TELE
MGQPLPEHPLFCRKAEFNEKSEPTSHCMNHNAPCLFRNQVLIYHMTVRNVHGGTVAVQQEGPGFDSRPGSYCMEFACFPFPVHAWVLTGYSGFLPQSKDMSDRLIGLSNLRLGV